ncbi:hypothetical protein AB4Z54_12915, partial [Streptomyces sp. MCAF7]
IEAQPLSADAPPPAPARRPMGGEPAAVWEPDWEALAVRWRARVGRVLDGYLRFAREWRPHLVLSDPVEFCGPIVAGALGVPSVVHRWGTDVLTTLARGPARAALRSVCERAGIPGGLLPDPDLLLDPCPPLLRHPRAAPAATPPGGRCARRSSGRYAYRSAPRRSSGRAWPPWRRRPPRSRAWRAYGACSPCPGRAPRSWERCRPTYG